MNRREFVSRAAAASASLALNGQRGYAIGLENSLGSGDSNNQATGDLKDLWPARSHPFQLALLPGPGFSFSYGHNPAGAPAIISQRDLGSSIETTFRYESGIEIVRSVVPNPDYDAIEYSLQIRNTGAVRSAGLQSIDALALSFGPKVLNGTYLVSSGGGVFDGTYPPEAFAIKKHYFDPTLPSDGGVTLTSQDGRSSNRDLPFYFIHNDTDRAGIFVGFGWTGHWASTISANYRTSSGSILPEFQLRGGIPEIDIQLDPGETIAGPHILIGSYEGSLADGSNKLRKLIRTHYTPKLSGKNFDVIATYDSWRNIEEHYDETLLRSLVDAAASIGQEYFLLDAAWYVGSNGPEGFSGGVGNWDRVDASKFPHGLAHFADYVRSRNLKFGLWFEPERVHRGSLLAKEHPDWIIWLDEYNNYGLLDYGHTEAVRWVREMMDRYITQLDIRYIRHDFNFDPLPYWNAKDAKNRRGITQIRHIEGFYSLIDWIRDQHPATVLECCAGGGRRIDLETGRRFHTYWISDDTIDPVIARFHLQGINYFLPGNYSYVQYTLPAPAQQDFQPSDFDYLSFFGGAFGTGGRVDLWSSAQTERFNVIGRLHKTVRPFLMKDYYPLLPQSVDLKGWDAWQFHDPDTNAGFVQVFRQQSDLSTLKLSVTGLRPESQYEFHDPLGSRNLQLSGAAAINEGLSFDIDRMSSQILVYKEIVPGLS